MDVIAALMFPKNQKTITLRDFAVGPATETSTPDGLCCHPIWSGRASVCRRPKLELNAVRRAIIPEHVPLILETPVPEDRIESEMQRVREALPVLSLTT